MTKTNLNQNIRLKIKNIMGKVKNISVKIKVKKQKLKETDFILVSFYENLKMVVHFGRLEKPTKNEPHQVGVWKIKIKK